MIYLKRFLYIFTISISYTSVISIGLLYMGLMPIGMIISFILTEEFTRFFDPLINFEKYLLSINDKLEDIFLNN